MPYAVLTQDLLLLDRSAKPAQGVLREVPNAVAEGILRETEKQTW